LPRWARWWPFSWCAVPITREIARRLDVGIAEGACLAPYLQAGDIVFVDREQEPKSGDLVSVAMRYARRGTALGDAVSAPIVRQAVKQYQRVDGVDHLTSADGSVPASAHTITGVVVAVQRRPSWRRWRCIAAPMRRLSFPVQPCAT